MFDMFDMIVYEHSKEHLDSKVTRLKYNIAV